ncbi:hypothetical protein WG908_03420 [Sphingobium sp. AN641]|uniref:hypothetical protein n=1 Tax=Sphingobium sp. AN641 TaxID=3133443 RepID=UPI0030BE1375
MDDGRLIFIDFTQAAHAVSLGIVTGFDVVAVGFSASALTIQRTLLGAPMRSPGKVFQIEGRHRAFQPDMQFRNFPFYKGDDLNAPVPTAFVNMRDVFLVTAQAVDRFGKKDIELSIHRG